MLSMVFRLHGTPSSFFADRDKLWTSEFYARWCSRLKVDLHLSSAYHPQTDGQTERMNRLLEEVLRHYIAPAHDNWDELLPLAEFAINRSVNASTGKSPFVVVYGYQPHTPLDRFYTALTDTSRTVTDKSGGKSAGVPAADDKLRDYQTEFARISKILQQAKDRQKSQYDKGRRAAPDYQVGDKVYVDTRILRVITVGTPKFLQRWQGPYEITKVIKGEVSKEVTAVRVKLPDTWRVHPTFHVSVVKPYPIHTREAPVPPTVMVEGHEEHVVEEVLAHRFTGRNRSLQFLVKWAGFGHEENKWLDEDNLTADGNFENTAVTAYWDKLAVEAGTHLVPTSGRTAAKPKLKAIKYVPKHKLAKPQVAKSKAKRKSGSKRPAEVPADAAPTGKRRKYPKRKGAPKQD
jgi:hypothetical protein